MTVRRNIWTRLGISAIISLLLVSCASKPSGYFDSKKQLALPDSARVKAVVSVSQEDANEKLSAVLFTVPNEKYRLELSGTFGLSAASILWKKDGWKVILPQNERYMEGTGNCVSIPVYGSVDIHKFATLFLGRRVDGIDCGNRNTFNLEYSGNAAIVSSGSDSLRLEIKSIEPKVKWGSGVWNLNVPDKYVRLTDY